MKICSILILALTFHSCMLGSRGNQSYSLVSYSSAEEECDIRSAAIEHIVEAKHAKKIAILSQTETNVLADLDNPEVIREIFLSIPDMTKELLGDFRNQNTQPIKIPNCLTSSIDHFWIGRAKLDEVLGSYFRETSKEASEIARTSWIVTTSKVVFGSNRETSLVYVSASGGLKNGEGLLCYLVKRDGKWIILSICSLWIS